MRNTYGFTLVELLTLIAIMCILAALLLPAMQRSLEHSRRTVCANNIQQIGIGISVYAEDYKGMLPGPTSVHTIANSLSLYAGYGWAPYAPKNLGYAVRGGYIDAIALLYCPSAQQGQSWSVSSTSTVYPGHTGLSCFTGEYASKLTPFIPADGTAAHRVSGYSFIPLKKRLAQIPANTPLLSDYILAYDWHGGNWNRLYPDGHVSLRESPEAVEKCMKQNTAHPGAPANWGDSYGIFKEICKP